VGRRHSPFKKILIGFDGSSQSEKATEIGLSCPIARCEVLLLAVTRPPEAATMVELSAMLDDAREHFEEKFKNAVDGNIAEIKPAGPGKGVLSNCLDRAAMQRREPKDSVTSLKGEEPEQST
jgi:nucleotide-binding universal stress UspA family protein